VLWIRDIAEQEVRKVEQAGSRSRQRPSLVLIVQLAKETELAPLLLDLLVRHTGWRLHLRQLGAPIHQDRTREQ
jgi:hypothetical protein